MTIKIWYSVSMARNRTIYDFSYKERRALRHKIYWIAGFICVLFAVVQILFNFLLFPVVVISDSMAPGAVPGSTVLVSPVVSYNRGDTVIVKPRVAEPLNFFQKALNEIAAFISFQQFRPFESRGEFSTTPSLRRVVGLPGDTVYMKDFILYIRPAGSSHFLTEFELSDKAYDVTVSNLPSVWDTSLGVAGVFPELTLDEDSYFLLSDSRTDSIDSRIWGPVPGKSIAGRVLFQYFPFSLFGPM